MECIAAGIPALIEKPLADELVAAQALSKPVSISSATFVS